MIEVEIIGIAKIIGSTASALLTKVREVQSRRSKSEFQKWAKMEAQFATPLNMAELLDQFYRGERRGSALVPYGVNVGGLYVKSTVYTNEEFLSINRPALDVQMRFSTGGDLPDVDLPKTLTKYATGVVERLAAMEVELWEAPLYRLKSVGHNPTSFALGEIQFLKYRFTSGLLADELADALVTVEGNPNQGRDELLPLRQELLPQVDSLLSFQKRNCCGGGDRSGLQAESPLS